MAEVPAPHLIQYDARRPGPPRKSFESVKFASNLKAGPSSLNVEPTQHVGTPSWKIKLDAEPIGNILAAINLDLLLHYLAQQY